MKRLALMVEQDFKLLLRNAVFWVVTASLVVIVLTVNFLIPKNFTALNTGVVTSGIGYNIPGSEPLPDAGAVKRSVAEEGALGLAYENGRMTLYHTGLDAKSAAAAASVLLRPAVELPAVQVTQLRSEPRLIQDNLRLLPVFICFEAIILGFLMCAVLMLGEKHEQVLRAYRISPGGTLRYVCGKTVLFTLLGTLYAALMAALTVGPGFDWLGFLALSLLGCALYTLLGLSLAVFFRDISGWFITALVVLAVNMLPAVSYSAPAFSPVWITALPSYTAIFAYAEILFPSGKSVALPMLLLAAETAAAFALCAALVRAKLLSAGREA